MSEILLISRLLFWMLFHPFSRGHWLAAVRRSPPCIRLCSDVNPWTRALSDLETYDAVSYRLCDVLVVASRP